MHINSHWLVQVSIIVLGTVCVSLITFIVIRLVGWIKGRKGGWRRTAVPLAKSLGPPLQLIIWGLGITWAFDVLSEHFWQESELAVSLYQVRRLIVIFALTWLVLRWKKAIHRRAVSRSKGGKSRLDVTGVETLGKITTLLIVALAALMALGTVGVDVTALVTAGGIGALALGIAAKDILANYFGGLMQHVTRPFAVGESVSVVGKGIDGTVEKMGWYLTCLRGLDQRPIFVPNSIFSSSAVMNNSRFTGRKIELKLGVRYQDFPLIVPIIVDIEALLRETQGLSAGIPSVVRFTEYGEYSLTLFVRAFTASPDWFAFLDIQQQILLGIGEIVRERGADFALPIAMLHQQPPEQA